MSLPWEDSTIEIAGRSIPIPGLPCDLNFFCRGGVGRVAGERPRVEAIEMAQRWGREGRLLFPIFCAYAHSTWVFVSAEHLLPGEKVERVGPAPELPPERPPAPRPATEAP